MKNKQNNTNPENNKMKKLSACFRLLGVLSFLALLLGSCSEESPLQVNQSGKDIISQPLQKRSVNTPPLVEIQSASGTVYYKETLNHYAGMGFGHPSGSQFILQPESLIPPDEIPWGDPVTITMTVEKDLANNTLIYTFEPSGCVFDPPATLWISWGDLGTDSADLYLIGKNDRFVPEAPDVVDYEGKKFMVLISHFSRYAVAYSN